MNRIRWAVSNFGRWRGKDGSGRLKVSSALCPGDSVIQCGAAAEGRVKKALGYIPKD